MPGVPNPLYIDARSALLDAADALVDHLDVIVLVGAQAIYLHTGEADLFDTVAEYTTDADLTINPNDLSDSPQPNTQTNGKTTTRKNSHNEWTKKRGPVNLAGRLKKLLDDELSASVTTEAIQNLTPLFGSADAVGVQMAVQAAGPGADPDFISASMTALVSDLVIALS